MRRFEDGSTSTIRRSLCGSGEVMNGATMMDDEALEYALNALAGSPFCVVRDWVWLDLDIPRKALSGVEPVGVSGR